MLFTAVVCSDSNPHNHHQWKEFYRVLNTVVGHRKRPLDGIYISESESEHLNPEITRKIPGNGFYFLELQNSDVD